MLTIVNEDLMSFDPTFVHDKLTNRQFFKLRVLTTNKLLQKQSDLNRKDERATKSITRTGENCLIDMSDKIVSVNREILRISVPYREIAGILESKEKIKSIPLEWNRYPMSTYVSNVSRYTRQVDIRCHTDGEDRATIYVIAFPFNGMIRPIREDPRYRVYKGFIASSIKPFFHAGHKYRKVLYLVVEINKNLFREDHQYHTDSIDIVFESFSLFTDKVTGERNTNHETIALNITSPNGDHSVQWDYEVIDHEVLMNVQNMDLWPTFTFNREKTETPSRYMKGKKKKTQRPVVIEGNTMVTTNKHGIRMEIPIGKNRRNTKPYGDNYYYDKDDSYKKDENVKQQNRSSSKSKKGRRK